MSNAAVRPARSASRREGRWVLQKVVMSASLLMAAPNSSTSGDVCEWCFGEIE